MIRNFLLATLSAIAPHASRAFADPLVYRCEIFDYTATGVERTEYQYTNPGLSKSFESPFSNGRVYLDDTGRLTLSLRPKSQTADNYFYSTVNGYNRPQRLDLTVSNGPTAYAARLVCVL